MKKGIKLRVVSSKIFSKKSVDIILFFNGNFSKKNYIFFVNLLFSFTTKNKKKSSEITNKY